MLFLFQEWIFTKMINKIYRLKILIDPQHVIFIVFRAFANKYVKR